MITHYKGGKYIYTGVVIDTYELDNHHQYERRMKVSYETTDENTSERIMYVVPMNYFIENIIVNNNLVARFT